MAGFFINKKSAPSSASKAASGVADRMSKNAGSKAVTKSGKGHFAAKMQSIAKLRAGILQHGVPHHAPTGPGPIGGSKKPGMGNVKPSEGQSALNMGQQGATTNKGQKGQPHDGSV